jgi:hypothetical protein
MEGFPSISARGFFQDSDQTVHILTSKVSTYKLWPGDARHQE